MFLLCFLPLDAFSLVSRCQQLLGDFVGLGCLLVKENLNGGSEVVKNIILISLLSGVFRVAATLDFSPVLFNLALMPDLLTEPFKLLTIYGQAISVLFSFLDYASEQCELRFANDVQFLLPTLEISE